MRTQGRAAYITYLSILKTSELLLLMNDTERRRENYERREAKRSEAHLA